MQATPQAAQQGQDMAAESVKKERDEDHVWRVIATTTTFVISWVVTGSVLAGS